MPILESTSNAITRTFKNMQIYNCLKYGKNTEAGFPLHNILKPSSNRSPSSESET